ncbi:DUF5919 domain-containing protein [Polaribacter sp. R77954]|uniref:DUF5919 domain-containing protein n=1 Tax=Polaribacter sp. R77954 TaxID=3093870 RepID=UPI0037C57751
MTKRELQEERNKIRKEKNNYKSLLTMLIIIGIGVVLFYNGNTQTDKFLASIYTSLGGAILSAGVIGFAYGIFLKRSFLKEVQDSIDTQFDIRYDELKSFKESGIIFSYNQFPTESIKNKINTSEKSIRILDTWIGNYMELESTLESAIKKGVEVEILLLNPDCQQAIQRSDDIGKTSNTYVKDQIRINLESISLMYDKLKKPSNLKVRIYDATPVFTSYSTDKSTFIGFYWRKSNAEKGNYLEVNNSNYGFGKRVKIHFVDLWNSVENEVDLNNFLTE